MPQMQSSPVCRVVIRGCEGLRLSLYRDANGFWTIGYGHKLTPEELTSKIYENGISQVQADELWNKDISRVDAEVNSLDLALTQGKFDCLVSFTYNLGLSNTQLLLSHGFEELPKQILRWIHAGKIALPGLVRRRETEAAWWQS